MYTADFNYTYPENLVATRPVENFRTMCLDAGSGAPCEMSKLELLNKFQPGDVLAINNTKVLRRRVTSENGLEILFLNHLGDSLWEVLFPARGVKDNEAIPLPGGVICRLAERGLPQKLQVENKILNENYFLEHGELALPPYIQKARGERHNLPDEEKWYQTAWAEHAGSHAAPTASLHFTNNDIAYLKSRGVEIALLTLHVGMGTFLPIKVKKLDEHNMHSEWAQLPAESVQKIITAKSSGRRVWALGTTATRTLESWGRGMLEEASNGDFSGNTNLFIRPGFGFEVVDGLLTNFHQPESTLLALVSAFAGRERVLKSYAWAIENKFRLFSYGDLSIWTKS